MAYGRRSPGRLTTPQNMGSSFETRPSPEAPSKSMRTRPFTKLVGGHDSELDPMYNEQGMSARNQVAQQTPDLMKRQGTTNPVKGTGQGVQRVRNASGFGTTQHDTAWRPSTGQKTSGRTLGKGASLRAKRKMRKACGQGGLAMPMQSGNTRSPLRGKAIPPRAGQMAPRGYKGS